MIVALLVLFSQLQGAAAQKAHTVGKACYATIRVPADDSVYSSLAILKFNKVHMTCPLNARNQNRAEVFILGASDLCGSDMLFGYPVISRSTLTDAKARRSYAECSGVIPGTSHKPRSDNVVTYLWNSQLPAEAERESEMNTLFGRVTGAVIASGLPVLSFHSRDDIFCFEMDAGFDQDPLTAIRGIGVKVPDSIRQTRPAESSCAEVFHMNKV
jgi:hypothetical protein